jgi:hypothetical protein
LRQGKLLPLHVDELGLSGELHCLDDRRLDIRINRPGLPHGVVEIGLKLGDVGID